MIAPAAACLALGLMLGGSIASVPATVEIKDAAQLIAAGDPAAPPPPGVFELRAIAVVEDDDAEHCRSYKPPARIPATARLGAGIALGHSVYTVNGVGAAAGGNGRVWLVADVSVAEPRCAGIAQLWEFIFVAADGTVYRPTPRGRRGEFTSYEIPAGGWATGHVFFDLPSTALRGGAVGFRRWSDPFTGLTPAATEPYGLWPLPASLPAVPAPDTIPAD